MAPEIIKSMSYDYKPDIWSAMVVIYILFINEMPFYGRDIKEIQKQILSKNIAWEIDHNPKWSKVSP